MSNRREFSTLGLSNNFRFTGNYSTSRLYQKNDVVVYKGQMWLYSNEAPLANIEPNIINVTSWQSIDGNSKIQTGILTSRPTAVVDNSGRLYYATDTQELYLSSGTSWSTVARVALATTTVPGLVKVFTNDPNPVVYRKETMDTLLASKASIGVNSDITSLTATTSITSTNVTATNLNLTTGNLATTPATSDPSTRLINKDFSDKRALAFINSNMNTVNDFYLGTSSSYLWSQTPNINATTLWWNVNVPNFNGVLANFSSTLTGRIALWETSSSSWVIRTSGRLSIPTSIFTAVAAIIDVFAQWDGTQVNLINVTRATGTTVTNGNNAAITNYDGNWCMTGAKDTRYVGTFSINGAKQIYSSAYVFNDANRKAQINYTALTTANSGWSGGAWYPTSAQIYYVTIPCDTYAAEIVYINAGSVGCYINSAASYYTLYIGHQILINGNTWTTIEQQTYIAYLDIGMPYFFPSFRKAFIGSGRLAGLVVSVYGVGTPAGTLYGSGSSVFVERNA